MSSIAIIGFSGLYPDADSPQQLYRNLLDGRNSIVRFSDSELRRSGIDEATIHDPSYKPFGTRLRRYKYFDNEFFGMTPCGSTNYRPAAPDISAMFLPSLTTRWIRSVSHR